jgi:hypothetical protein
MEDSMNKANERSQEHGQLLPKGCYFVQYRPKQGIDGVMHFDGVLRHTPENPRIKASADLYAHPAPAVVEKSGMAWCCEGLAERMPVFPRDAYSHYLEIQQIGEGYPDAVSVSLQFQVHRFDAESKRFSHRGGCMAILTRRTPGEGMRAPYFVGTVFNEQTSEIAGEMRLSLVSEDFVREAVVQIDSGGGIPLPLTDEQGDRDWAKVFGGCHWKISVESSEAPAPVQELLDQALKRAWTDAELHAEMQRLSVASGNEPDAEWRYHLLCVGTFANPQYERGVMYDVGGSDLNQTPREGAAIAAGWSMAGWSEKWRPLSGKSYFHESKDLYFRTAVHEIGHAMGLEHSHNGSHFMNTTDALEQFAQSQTQEIEPIKVQADRDELFARVQADALENLKPDPVTVEALRKVQRTAKEKSESAAVRLAAAGFPTNIAWDFSEADKDRLQHGPDVMVRSGTFVEGTIAGFGDGERKRADGLELELTPLLESVPLGAPVRVRLTLRNRSDREREVPLTLHLKSGCVDGAVFSPGDQRARPFYPLMRCMDSERGRGLRPGEALHHSLTLLRGHEGALFTRPGDHQVRVRVSWRHQGTDVYLENEMRVRVEAAINSGHKMAALSLLNAPEALHRLALGADGPVVGDVIEACLAVPVLRPHYAVIKLKQLLSQAANKALAKQAIAEALELLAGDIVMSVSEVNRTEAMLLDLVKAGKSREAELAPLQARLGEKGEALKRAEQLQG